MPEVARCSSSPPCVCLLHETKVDESLRLPDTFDAPDGVVEDSKEMLVILADELDQDVERACADDDVLELGQARELVCDVTQVPVGSDADEGLACEADGERICHGD